MSSSSFRVSVSASAHWAQDTSTFLNARLTLISPDLWPPNSPDLNPLEYQIYQGRQSPPLGPLRQPPPFSLPFFPLTPAMSSFLRPSTFPSSPCFSFLSHSAPFSFLSLPCRNSAPIGGLGSAVSSQSGVWGGAPAAKAFWVHFEPRNRVWSQRFWFFLCWTINTAAC